MRKRQTVFFGYIMRGVAMEKIRTTGKTKGRRDGDRPRETMLDSLVGGVQEYLSNITDPEHQGTEIYGDT